MSDQQYHTGGMRAVTMSREYGSGGGEVAAGVAQRLGWQLIDHEVVARVAEQLGISESDAAARDERDESFVVRFLHSMRGIEPPALAVPTLPLPLDPYAYATALREVVTGAAEAGRVVIVGRAGQVILRERRDALHVRVVTPFAQRIAYVMQREGLDHVAAERRVRLKDQDRRQYMQNMFRCQPDDAHLYDLVLNTAVLDLESCADLICRALERKATRLTAPAEALGPAAGMPQYPGAPEDLPVPHPPAEQR
ncbi:MAG: Cytidylate kinase [Ktedonobacterales bacterium]|jgi:cytidylate kinase|nr:MAG: Cytidylate kinase [Ktedonobacterales bacterium]